MVVLSKENYIAIAAILKESTTKDQIVMGLSIYFKKNNPRFDTGRFLKAAVGRVSPFRETMGRAVELNQKLEEMVLGQAKETYWIVAKSTRGLWDQVELKTDLAQALISGERISELNPNKQVIVLLQIKSFFESALERIS